MARLDGDGDRWAADLVKRVGSAVKAARGGQSAAWLSERTAELGYRISPTVIAKLDSGHRGTVLGVAELVVLAAALDVPPLALLFPDLPDGEVEFLPGEITTSWDAYQRATGMDARPNPTPATRLVQACLERAKTMRNPLLTPLVTGDMPWVERMVAENETLRKAMELQIAQDSAAVDRLNQVIRESGGTIKDA